MTELVVGEPLVPPASPSVFDSLAHPHARTFLQLCDVVDYLHSQDLVHCNLAPDGLLVQQNGGLKVVDLGHCEDVAASERFWHREPHGTPSYSSPEHFLGGRLVPESDYFVVGVLLWEALTDAHPFPTSTLPELLTTIHRGAPTPLPAGRVPRVLADVLRDLLDLDLSARRAAWQRLRELLADVP